MYLSPRSRAATYRLLLAAALLLLTMAGVDLARGQGVEWWSLAAGGALLGLTFGRRAPRTRP